MMDPNETLKELRNLAEGGVFPDEIEVFIEHFQTLDEWLSRGGFLPREWDDNRNAPTVL